MHKETSEACQPFSKETEELMRVQENCSDFLQIIADKLNKKPQRPSRFLRDIYQNQFVNINEQQLRGIYNDRQRNLRKVSK